MNETVPLPSQFFWVHFVDAVSFDRICFICIKKKNINKTVLMTSKSGNNLIPLKQFTLYTIMHVLNFKSYILIISVFAFSLIFNFFFSFTVFFIWLFLSSLLRRIKWRLCFQKLPAFDWYFSNLGTELSRPAVKQVIIVFKNAVFDRNTWRVLLYWLPLNEFNY